MLAYPQADINDALAAQGYTDVPDILFKTVMRTLYGLRRWSWLQAVMSYQFTVANLGVITIGSLGSSYERPGIVSVRIARGTAYYDDDDFSFVDDIRLTELRHVDRMTGRPRLWSRVSNYTGGTNPPSDIHDTIQCWPLPDATYDVTVRFDMSSPTIASLPDPINWPSQHIDVVIESLVMALARQQRDTAMYDRAKANFEEALRRAIADDTATQRQTMDQVQEWRGWSQVT